MGMAVIVALAVLFGAGKLSRETLTLVSFFDADVSGLREGSPVSFRGVELGAVTQVLLSLPNDPRVGTEDVRIAVTYDLDLLKLRAVSPGTHRDFTDPVQVEELIEAGLRVAMKTTNFLSGIKALEMDVRPDVPDTRLHGVDLPYPEVPTIPNRFEVVEARLEEMATNLAELPLDSIAWNLNTLLEDMSVVLNSVEGPALVKRVDETLLSFSEAANELATLMSTIDTTVTPAFSELDETLAESRDLMGAVETTLAHLRTETGPESPLSYRTLRLLEEMELMMKSMRQFIDYLNANPSALLKGRTGGGE